ANGASRGDLNSGFLDQIQALCWMQTCIAKVGGDRTRATINGARARARPSVALRMTIGAGWAGLFGQGIAQSVYRTQLAGPRALVHRFEFYAEQAGCGGARTREETVGSLGKADMVTLGKAQDAANGLCSSLRWAFTDHPSALFQAGDFAKAPLIVGATSNETLSSGTDIPSALKSFFPAITDADVGAIVAAYPADDFTGAEQVMQFATGDAELRCGREVMSGAAAKSEVKTWTYTYNQANPTGGSDAAGHAAENWMVFRGSNTGADGTVTVTPQSPVELAFAAELIAYRLSFVRAGDSNAFKLAMSPPWDGYGADGSGGQAVRIEMQQDSRNGTSASGSYTERQLGEEGERCVLVGGMVEDLEN
ncbi:alpha beta-hydrolase, partial [Coniophora puteana RWD-64-598 SS2]